MPERFSASVAGRHMACHASANLELAIPGYTPPVQSGGAAAAKGTSIHEIYEEIWNLAPAEVRAIARTVQYVADLRSTRRFKVMAEQEFEATWLTTAPKTKPDLVLYTQDEIHVVDTKNGKIPVEVVENEQLMYYAVCAAPLAPKAKGVTVHILQPNADNMASWYVDTPRLKQFMDDAIATEQAILNGSVTFGPSDHCTFCDANPRKRGGQKGHPLCPELMQLYGYGTKVDEDAILNA